MIQSAVDLRNRDVFEHRVSGIGQIMEHLYCTATKTDTRANLASPSRSLCPKYIWHASPERYSHSERRQGCHEDRPLLFHTGRRKSTRLVDPSSRCINSRCCMSWAQHTRSMHLIINKQTFLATRNSMRAGLSKQEPLRRRMFGISPPRFKQWSSVRG
jgi:hypothetical protein